MGKLTALDIQSQSIPLYHYVKKHITALNIYALITW